MRGLWKGLLGVILAGSALLASVACDGATRAQLEGILQNVDSISGEVTVTLKDGGTVTFNLKDVNVETLRQAAGSASLEPGTQVTLETDKDKKVKTVKARQSEVDGVIKSINQADSTITILDEDGKEVTLKVTAETEIEVEDDEDGATLAALSVGQEVEAKYDVETKRSLKIEVEEEEEEGADVKGVIISINNEAKTITIRAENSIETTLKMMSRTELEGVKTFDALKTGMRVKVEFNPATKELIELELEEEQAKAEIRGTITAINKDAKTVTIKANDGSETTFKATATTEFDLDGVKTFDALTVGMKVKAKINPASNELIKLELRD